MSPCPNILNSTFQSHNWTSFAFCILCAESNLQSTIPYWYLEEISHILQRSLAWTLPHPWVPGEVSSPLLSENRWNQIKTAGNEGNGFWVVWADRTGPGPEELQPHFNICAAILGCSRRWICRDPCRSVSRQQRWSQRANAILLTSDLIAKISHAL